MASAATCKQQPYMVKGDKGYLYVDFSGVLDSGVTLTGTPTIAEVTTSGLTLSQKAVNAAAITMFGEQTVAIGKAAQVFVDTSSATAGTTYRIRVTATTTENSSTGVRIRDVLLKVIATGEDA